MEGLDDLSAAQRGLEAVQRLCSRVKIPTLSGYGIDREALRRSAPKMPSDAIASGSPGNNPRQATAEEIVDLYMLAS